MAQLIQGQTGPNTSADGGQPLVRLGRTGETITQNLHGRYYEQAKRASLFSAMTAITGVAPGTAFGTTAAFTLANPSASAVDLSILFAAMGYVSGTLGAGVVCWLSTISGTAPSGTAITVQTGRLGGSAAANGLAYTTATIPSSPVLVRPAFNLQASLASTAVAPWIATDPVEGAIVVAPGNAISLHATAASGSSPLVVFYVVWEEVPS